MSESKLPSNVVTLIAGLERAQVAVQASGPAAAHPFLKMSKIGEWVYGADGVEVEEGSEWAINPHTLATGFIAWNDGECAGERMALVTEDAVDSTQLPNVGAQWKPQVGMQLACISGADKGQQVIYRSNSVGGQRAFKKILDEVLRRAQAGETDLVPVVELDVESYKHQKYGTIFNPVFKTVRWADMNGVVSDAESPEAAEEEPAPRRRSRRG